jgi:hypothetical protein
MVESDVVRREPLAGERRVTMASAGDSISSYTMPWPLTACPLDRRLVHAKLREELLTNDARVFDVGFVSFLAEPERIQVLVGWHRNTVVTLMFVVSIAPAVQTVHGNDKGKTTIDEQLHAKH